MALQSFGTSIGAGIQADLGLTDSAFVAAGGLVSSRDDHAILGTGSSHFVHVQGTVVAEKHAILLGGVGQSNEHVLIDSTGFVGSYGNLAATFAAISVVANSSTVENRGTIFGTGPSVGLGVAFSGSAGQSSLINSGTIEARTRAVTHIGTGVLAVTNSGTIEGAVHAYLDFNGTAIDGIVNTGTMIGTINLGGLDDSYSGAFGRLTGTVLAGSGNDTVTGGVDNDLFEGGADNDVLRGNGGNDRLDGGAGTDQMFGGIGNNTYLVDSVIDIVNEAGGNGNDTVFSSISFNLANAARVIGAVENLTLNGPGVANGFGNGLANVITGNNFNNTLNGLGGNDTLIGGLGRDTMAGGVGNDIFRFAARTHSGIGVNADVITDFDDFGNDRIDVSALFGPAMTYRHNLGFTAAGQVRINDIAGADLLVEVNTGGSLAADFAIRLTGTTLGSMAGSDFFL